MGARVRQHRSSVNPELAQIAKRQRTLQARPHRAPVVMSEINGDKEKAIDRQLARGLRRLQEGAA